MHSFILFARLNKEVWIGLGRDCEYRSYSAEELLKICDETNIFKGGYEFIHWTPDQDFQELFEIDELVCLHKFAIARNMPPRFFSDKILTGPNMIMGFFNGSFVPFKKEDLFPITSLIDNKQPLWKDMIDMAEPKANYKSLDELIKGVNNEGK